MRGRVARVAAAMALAVVGMFASVAPAGAAPAASTPIDGRIPWARTNGDILAMTKVEGAGADLIAFGGNFTHVITPDGVSRDATNFAVVDEFTGALVYAGHADSYVRAITSRNGTIYVGGDFTTFGGVARNRLAALSPTYQVTSWNPGASAGVYALESSSAGVYFGGNGSSVKLVDATTGATVMSQSVTGGSVKSLLVSPDSAWLYVGGGFETYGGLTRHGLVRANALTGAPDQGFNAHLRVDSGVGTFGDFDGEAGKALAFDSTRNRLVAGIAGHGADELKIFSATTGALVWVDVLPGDGQAVGIVGDTYLVGYHRHDTNPWPYFAAQVEASNGALTNWDPGVEGFQANEDGGNNGVQAMYIDPANRRVFLGGAFLTPVKSIAVYTWGPPVTPPTNQTPTASFTATTNGLTATFDGTGSADPDGSVVSWAWTFGDGTTATGANANHAYVNAGTYTVTLKVTDNRGATDTTSKKVTVTAPPPTTTTTTTTPPTTTIPPADNRTPIGAALITNLADRRYSMLGYAIDPDTDAPIEVVVAVEGVGETTLTADYELDGLPDTHPGYGPKHGFLYSKALPAGTRNVCAYALDSTTGARTAISCQRVTVK